MVLIDTGTPYPLCMHAFSYRRASSTLSGMLHVYYVLCDTLGENI